MIGWLLSPFNEDFWFGKKSESQEQVQRRRAWKLREWPFLLECGAADQVCQTSACVWDVIDVVIRKKKLVSERPDPSGQGKNYI